MRRKSLTEKQRKTYALSFDHAKRVRMRRVPRVVAKICLSLLFVPYVGVSVSAEETIVVDFVADATLAAQRHDGGIVGWAFDLGQPWRAGIAKAVNDGFPLMRSHISLAHARHQPLDEAWLASLSSGFDIVREVGGKVIVRFFYSSPAVLDTGFEQEVLQGKEPDAPLATVLGHIRQLGPILARHQDVIGWFEAGFIGAWGEWHTSSNGLDSPGARAEVRDALLAHFPEGRQILFRDPADLQRWFPDGRTGHVQRNGMPAIPGRSTDRNSADRIGLHNDCFLSTLTDGNTYPRPGLRDFAKLWNRGTAFGGETCLAPPWRMRCDDILSEGSDYSLTYLNGAGGNREFEVHWRQQGCLGQVRASIGPRIELVRLEHPLQVTQGAELPLAVTVDNGGWSRVPNRRELYLMLLQEDGKVSHRLDLDIDSTAWLPRNWRGNQAPAAMTVRLDLPVAVAPGRYRVALASPDPSPRLAADPRFALRFANQDLAVTGQRWDDTGGWFLTGSTLTVR